MRQDGSVADVEILSGPPILAQAVKANLLRWTFKTSDVDKEAQRNPRIVLSLQLKGDCNPHRKCNEEFWFEYPDRVSVVSKTRYLNPVSDQTKDR